MTSNPPKLRTLFQDPEYYAKAFEAYSKRSSRLSVLKKWSQTTFPEKVVTKLTNKFGDGLANGSIRILGVGSGTGEMDCDMINQIQPKFSKIHSTVLEPALTHIEKYKDLVTSRGFCNVEWEWRQQGLDEFYKEWKKQGSDAKKYNFISSVHSLYYVDDPEQAVMNMYEMLEGGGVMMHIVLADDSGFGRLWRRFPMFTDEVQSHFLSDSLRDLLTTKAINFEAIKQPSRVDISCCFVEGDEGRSVSDFLAHVIDLRGSVSANVLDEFYEYLGESDCSIKEGDRVLFNNMWEAVIVQK